MYKVEYNQKYRDNNREKERARWRKYSRTKRKPVARDPVKQKARAALRNAVAAGKITKPKKCSACGVKATVHGHHEDYSKPFEVEWLCSVCHGLRHRIAARAALAPAQPTEGQDAV
jgi:hypothetical protein